jgi:two-component system, chemotaxis family, chemotaxis protein CheY
MEMLKKILLVDDSALIHQMYRLALGRYRCEILAAMNGREALDLLALHNDIQLVLLDINMPVMNGVQFLEKRSLLGVQREIPVIVVSTEGEERDTIKALEFGAAGYLTKPFTPTQLREMIGKVLPASTTAHLAGV